MFLRSQLRRFAAFLLFVLVTLGSAAAYESEFIVGGGVEAGLMEGAFVRGTYRAGFGYPVSFGKVSLAGQVAAGMGLGATASVGWGQEWYLSEWFSWEAALMLNAGLVEPVIGVNFSPDFFTGAETLFRATVFFFDGDLGLAVVGGPSVRWVPASGAQVVFTIAPLLALRFD